MALEVLFKKLHPAAQMPHRASEHAAAFDLFAATTHVEDGKIIVGTGLATAFPEDHVLLIYSRSGHGFRHGIRLLNSVAVIDADFRGEIKLAFSPGLLPLMAAAEMLASGHRVAQAMVMPVPRTRWIEVAEGNDLPPSIRGEGGFGSTGS